MVDMLNHKEPKGVTWEYDSDRKGAVVKAITNIPRGGQLFDTYGADKKTYSFFYCYGFVDENCGSKH